MIDTQTRLPGAHAALLNRVREVLATTFSLDEQDVPDDLEQGTCRQWTSLQHMLLLVALEDEFQVKFGMDEMISMTSIPRIVTALATHQQAR